MGLWQTITREVGTILTLMRMKKWTGDIDPESDNLIADDFERVVDKYPNNVAWRFEGNLTTYAEMDALANKVANWGLGLGLQSGDAVALFMENRPEYVSIWYGLAKIGVVTGLINHNLTDKALAHCVNIADAKLIITGADQDEAIRHIFRVACGLDSMVLGEPQILGQLKDAVRDAQQAGTLGSQLGTLFQHTFKVAKKVRTETEIGANPVSVASAAVSLAQQFFAGFSQHTALLIGAGTTIELVAKHLDAKDLGRLFVANRNLERAKNLASQFGGYAVPLSELEGTLPEADIIITSTAS